MDKSIFFKNYTAAKAAHSEIKRNARQSSKSPNFDGDLRYISQIILSDSYVSQYYVRDAERLKRIKIRFDSDLPQYRPFSDARNNRLGDWFMTALEMAWYAVKHNLSGKRLCEYLGGNNHFSGPFAESLYNEISERYSDPEFHVLAADEIYYGKGGSK